MSDLSVKYSLTEEDLKREISDSHLCDIAQNHCVCWKLLPSRLDLPSNIAKDICCENLDEPAKRLEFFQKWKRMKGSCATYKALICALLNINERLDAESICKILKSPLDSQSAGKSTV